MPRYQLQVFEDRVDLVQYEIDADDPGDAWEAYEEGLGEEQWRKQKDGGLPEFASMALVIPDYPAFCGNCGQEDPEGQDNVVVCQFCGWQAEVGNKPVYPLITTKPKGKK